MRSKPFAAMSPSVAVAVVSLCLLALPTAALAIGQTSEGLFSRFERTRDGGVIGLAAQSVDDLPADDTLRRDWDAFRAAQGGRWSVWLDGRSGLPSLVQGRGIAWAPGAGNDLEGPEATIDSLAARAEQFFRDHAVVLGVGSGRFVLDREASARRGDHVWNLVFRQVVDDVLVEGSAYEFQVSHGNLVSFGARRWADVRTPTTPQLTAADARARLNAYLGLDGSIPTRDLADPELILVPVDPARAGGAPWTGARGAGYDHRLIWRFRFADSEEIAIWTGEIDARTGEVFAFYDDTRYDRVLGHVNPISDDGDCATGGCPEPGYPMPFVNWTEDGGPTQYTDDFGLLECSTLGSTVQTTLNGLYFTIADQCGAILESTTCDDPLDLGVAAGINCSVAPGASAGNTDAARSAYYSLNRVNQKGRFWHGPNAWLEGKVTCRSNVNSTCNASWGGQINMYRAGNGCGNTSQIQGVVVHEWGHGYDQNDGGGYDNPSEAYADVVAIFEARESCVGHGFFNDGRTCSGYGDTCLTCTGIRDMDWAARTQNTPATPANFTQPNCGGGGGPCGREVHCESYVPSEAIFDVATRDLPASGLDPDTSWQLAERLWYQSRPGSGGDMINCSLPNADSCGTGTWFQQMRVQDDDDGNLANGTPHAAALYAAFARHGIACGTANAPENQSTGSCTALATPTFTTRALTNAVELTWDPVAGASAYRVYRNENGCDRSQVPLAEVAAPGTTYLDDGLANDFPVFYRVQAIGSNPACESAVSTCTEAAAQALAGRVKFDRATYGCSNTIGLRVTDANHSSGSMNVEVWSDTEPTPEIVTLVETSPGSGKFDGALSTTSAAPAADGLLSITDGDTLTARYIDEDDGNGNTNVPQLATALGDCVFPVITGVNEQNVTGSSATVVWTTNEGSSTVVRWGETTPPASESTGSDRVTAHSVNLGGLQECTVYWYEVESVDPAGNVATDDNGGQWFRFETLGDLGAGLQPCHAGQVVVGTATYSCSDSVTFQVTDLDLNSDPLVAETTTLLVTSTTEAIAEVVTATETGPNTSVFAASIGTSSGAPVADGLIQVADGDLITVTYQDTDDGAGYPAVSFDTAVADCAPARVTNLAVSSITQARATFSWSTTEAADTTLEWGTTPALGNTVHVSNPVLNHSVTVSEFDLCGDVWFRVSGTDRYGNPMVYDDGGQPFSFRTYDIPGLYVLQDFENGAPGWTLQGEWEVGTPAGLGGSSGLADPTDAYNNAQSLGVDLSGTGTYPGDYEPSSSQNAVSPVWNSTTWNNTKLIFHRRLNVGNNDQASLWLYFGPQGLPFYRNEGNALSESAWSVQSLDISSYADGAPSFKMEFKMSSDGAGQYSGWNVDDIIVKDGSLPDYAPCGSCGAAPSFAGATSATDNDACGATGVTVSWQKAPAWGTGAAGTYAVYRDTVPGFVPTPGNLVVSGITTLSYNDAGAPADATLYYLVRAENAETCSTGPANGGMVDDNAAYVAVGSTSSQPIPGEVSGVLVDPVAATHVRLTWPAVPSATSYRILRSPSPDPATFGVLATVDGTVFDDIGEMTNANTYFYKVQALNACGQQGP